MRDLTIEELALAPEWATHYIVDGGDSVIYESKVSYWWVGMESTGDNYSFDESRNRFIQRHPFDITEHEWSDGECQLNNRPSIGECLMFYCESSLDEDGGHFGFELNKQDAIAIAKHFKLTAEGLK